jgi:hypothetical protein
MVDDGGVDLVAQFDAALQRATMGIGVGDLIEDQGRWHAELDRALFDALAEEHHLQVDPLLQGQAMVNGTVAVHQVHQIAAFVQVHAHQGAVVHPAYE